MAAPSSSSSPNSPSSPSPLAFAPRSHLRAWLQLIRVPALPTALADVWLGAAVAGALFTWQTAIVSFASLCLYSAGMILNDVQDTEEDRKDNPARPLPAGAITERSARIGGGGLLAVGIAAGFTAGPETGLVAVFLALLVVVYDFAMKRTVFGPLNMGLCRAANVALALSLSPALLNEPFLDCGAAMPILLYVTVVSALARFEDRQPRLRPIIRAALIGIVPLQALVATAHGEYVAAACILGLLLPVFLLRRLSHIT
jgi:4-hydroxybenzoate polyprenyltransferase